MPNVRNNLRALRDRTGISASDLAAQVGVSRQSIHAMEAGSYVPNTAVALALARVLETSVEQLFSLEDTERSIPATLLGSAFEGQPLHIAEVGGKVIAVPSSPAPYYLAAADAIAGKARRGSSVRAQILSPSAASSRIVIAGCDPAISLINAPLLAAPASSRTALQWLKDGLVHVAGSHLHNNAAALQKAFPEGGVTLISFATWEEGLVVAPGNPKSIQGIEDLARKDVRFINREPGAAIRTTLDSKLKPLDPDLRAALLTGICRPHGWSLPGLRIARLPHGLRHRPSDYPSSLCGLRATNLSPVPPLCRIYANCSMPSPAPPRAGSWNAWLRMTPPLWDR